MPDLIEKTYRIARRRYQAAGVNAEGALRTLGKVRLSLNCWQGDDVQGFEMNRGLSWSGGIQATGGHPGRARNAFELRRDLARALKLIPGRHRVNLHAMYGEFGAKEVDRDGIKREHFAGWIDWAREHKLALDFNATLFNHPKAAGFTLSSKQRLVRDFWIEHVKRSRSIAAHIGRRLRQPCVCNLWIPDGMKDHCADRRGFRRILTDSLDEIYRVRYSTRMLKDSLEPKLFGIGAESCTVGSFEFY